MQEIDKYVLCKICILKVIHFYFTDWCATYDLDSLGVYLDTQTIKLSNAETEYLLKMRKEKKKLETYTYDKNIYLHIY